MQYTFTWTNDATRPVYGPKPCDLESTSSDSVVRDHDCDSNTEANDATRSPVTRNNRGIPDTRLRTGPRDIDNFRRVHMYSKRRLSGIIHAIRSYRGICEHARALKKAAKRLPSLSEQTRFIHLQLTIQQTIFLNHLRPVIAFPLTEKLLSEIHDDTIEQRMAVIFRDNTFIFTTIMGDITETIQDLDLRLSRLQISVSLSRDRSEQD